MDHARRGRRVAHASHRGVSSVAAYFTDALGLGAVATGRADCAVTAHAELSHWETCPRHGIGFRAQLLLLRAACSPMRLRALVTRDRRSCLRPAELARHAGHRPPAPTAAGRVPSSERRRGEPRPRLSMRLLASSWDRRGLGDPLLLVLLESAQASDWGLSASSWPREALLRAASGNRTSELLGCALARQCFLGDRWLTGPRRRTATSCPFRNALSKQRAPAARGRGRWQPWRPTCRPISRRGLADFGATPAFTGASAARQQPRAASRCEIVFTTRSAAPSTRNFVAAQRRNTA